MSAERVSEAVEQYLEGRDLFGNGQVLAATARALATQLDAACESGTARGLSAAPPLARRLVEVVTELDAREGAVEAAVQKAVEKARSQEQRRRDATWAANRGV